MHTSKLSQPKNPYHTCTRHMDLRSLRLVGPSWISIPTHPHGLGPKAPDDGIAAGCSSAGVALTYMLSISVLPRMRSSHVLSTFVLPRIRSKHILSTCFD